MRAERTRTGRPINAQLQFEFAWPYRELWTVIGLDNFEHAPFWIYDEKLEELFGWSHE